MDVIVLIGRIIFATIFVGSAMAHLTKTDYMAGYAESKKVPAARPVVLGTGLLILVGSLLIVLGLWPDLGALLLVVFLFPTAFVMHGFWGEDDPEARANEQIQFMKDLSLGGAALVMFGLFAYMGDELGLQITGSLFGLGG